MTTYYRLAVYKQGDKKTLGANINSEFCFSADERGTSVGDLKQFLVDYAHIPIENIKVYQTHRVNGKTMKSTPGGFLESGAVNNDNAKLEIFAPPPNSVPDPAAPPEEHAIAIKFNSSEGVGKFNKLVESVRDCGVLSFEMLNQRGLLSNPNPTRLRECFPSMGVAPMGIPADPPMGTPIEGDAAPESPVTGPTSLSQRSTPEPRGRIFQSGGSSVRLSTSGSHFFEDLMCQLPNMLSHVPKEELVSIQAQLESMATSSVGDEVSVSRNESENVDKLSENLQFIYAMDRFLAGEVFKLAGGAGEKRMDQLIEFTGLLCDRCGLYAPEVMKVEISKVNPEDPDVFDKLKVRFDEILDSPRAQC